jgi:hypothetical protein
MIMPLGRGLASISRLRPHVVRRAAGYKECVKSRGRRAFVGNLWRLWADLETGTEREAAMTGDAGCKAASSSTVKSITSRMSDMMSNSCPKRIFCLVENSAGSGDMVRIYAYQNRYTDFLCAIAEPIRWYAICRLLVVNCLI